MKCCVFDLETSIQSGIHGSQAKDPSNDFYTLIYGSNPNDNSLQVVHRTGGFRRTLPQGIFQGVDVVVGHNLSFDVSYVWNDMGWNNFIRQGGTIWDTQHAEYLLSGQRHLFASLAELQKIYLGSKIKKDRISKLFKAGIGADKIIAAQKRCPRVWKLYNEYALDDGRTTLLIFKKQALKAKELGMLPILKAHMRALIAIYMMENTGINVDIQACEETLKEFRIKALDKLQEASALVKHLWDERLGPFNINSPKQKSAILFGGEFTIDEKVLIGQYKNGNPKYGKQSKVINIKGFGLPLKYTTNSKIEGRYVTDDAVVLKLLKECKDPTVKKYLTVQKEAMQYNKMASTYLEPFIKYSIDGILYPKYNTCQTKTGRLSSSNPNMQNIPASGDNLVPIQGKLVSPEGYICCDIDYGQLEPHVTALLTGDISLTNDLLSGACLHCRALSWVPNMSEGKTYEEIYQLAKVEENPKWVLKRKKAKGINFKRAYGGGARGLAEAEGLALEDVQAIFDAQDVAYPQVKTFNDNVLKTAENNIFPSRKEEMARMSLGGKQFRGDLELLPIFDGDKKKTYIPNEFRYYGVYQSLTGRKYTFEEVGQLWRGSIHHRISTTQTKNYQIQGTAADIVSLACSYCMEYVFKNIDVRMVRQIHDSIGFYIKKGTEELHIKALCDIMSNVPKMFEEKLGIVVPFSFPVESKIGENFAEMVVYNAEKYREHEGMATS